MSDTTDEARTTSVTALRERKRSIVAHLVTDGAEVAQATMYADLFLEYEEASENIERNGVIVQHPRTMNPIENPYVRQRDKARRELAKLRWIQAPWLWEAK